MNGNDKSMTVYKDEKYTLGTEDGIAYLIANGRRLTLSCHPYEPCLYIKDEAGNLTVVHNAFDPSAVRVEFYS